MKLRDYQEESIIALRKSIASGKRKPILVSPTGSGKTRVATEIVKSAVEKGKWVLFLAPRRELIYQTVETFKRNGIDAGMIMAGEPRSMFSKVQVASFDTLHARGIRSDKMMMPKADVIIADECHLSISKSRTDIIGHYHDKIVIGLTATPARGDGKGLGRIYDDLVQVTNIRDLTEKGYLVPVKYYAPTDIDLAGVKQTKSDYVVSDLGKIMDKKSLIGDIYSNWKRIAGDKKTVIFCTTRAHSRHVRDEFLSHGIKAEHLDGETPPEERKQILARVDSGETQVLCNVFVASYGLDIPSLECVVLARPTKNITLYHQICGRALRISEGKDHAIVIDHAGAIKQHGFVDDYVPWTLEDKDVRELKDKIQKEKKEPKEIKCPACGSMFKGSRICPSCGHTLILKGKEVPVHEAELQEVVLEGKQANRKESWDQKQQFMSELKGYAMKKGYKQGWAAYQYKLKYGVWGSDKRVKDAPPKAPTMLVMGWVKHQAMKNRFRKAG